MNIDHVVGFLGGVLLAAILLVPLCILVVWLVRSYRSRLESEELRAAELAQLLDDLRRSIESVRGESDKWTHANADLETAKLQWKKQFDNLLQKHNTLVRTHNDLVRKYNALLKDARSHVSAKTKVDAQLREVSSEVQDVRRQLEETLAGKHELLKESQRLQGQIEGLVSERSDLQQKLAETLQRLKSVAATPPPDTPTHDVTVLLGEIDELRRKVSESGQTHTELASQIDRFRREMEEVSARNEDISKQVIEERRTSSNMARDLASAQEKRDLVERENQQLRVENQLLEQKRQEAVTQHERVSQDCDIREREAENLRSENFDLAQRFEDLARHLQTALAGLSAGYEDSHQDASFGLGEESVSSNGKLVVPPWQDTRPVVVGLDFGTYSTKVIVRIRGEKKSRAIFIDEPADGDDYPGFAVPSLVRLKGGKLFFGRRALQENEGTLFRSLKVALLPPTSRDGWLQEPFPTGTTPDLLVAFYLSWILGQLKGMLGKKEVPQLSLNVAAPMDHLEDAAMKERYLHVVHAAWQATFGPYPIRVDQGVDLHHFRPLFEFWLERNVPDLTVRKFEVLPETLAPLVSLSQDPRVRSGFYMMVDMGAGTTELSISHVNERDADHRILCYSDTSVFLGGNQFNENDIKNAGKSELRIEEERLKKQLMDKINSVWYHGFEKDKDDGRTVRNRWKQLNVILSGGGLRRPGLQSAIEKAPPMKFIFGNDHTDYSVEWHQPADLEFFGTLQGSKQNDLPRLLGFLAVAHGLSLERQKWPKWHSPSSVERSAREEKSEDPFSFGYLEW